MTAITNVPSRISVGSINNSNLIAFFSLFLEKRDSQRESNRIAVKQANYEYLKHRRIENLKSPQKI
jgi:hypothetical protein